MVSGPKTFGDPTHWGVRPESMPDGWTRGWVPPNADFYIDKADKYWGRVLDEARQAYGDPNIHYNTNQVDQERYLVFGDGTRLPEDGTVVYHDCSNGRTFRQNSDGTVCPIGDDGRAGAPLSPAAYRRAANGSYAPVDGHGQQVAPLQAGIPGSDNGLHTDPTTGLLTPKNAEGDYYTLGPDGEKSYFDKNRAPITADRFTTGAPAAGPPGSGVLATDEQQSGRAADAVKKLQDDLKHRYTTISDAEEKLSEVLLNAHATTAEGQRQLNAIQHKIVDAVDNPALSLDTPAGEEAFLRFLRSQIKDIGDVVNSGGMTADDQAKAAQALGALYGADAIAEHPGQAPAADPPAAGPLAPDTPGVPATPVAQPVPAVTDPGLGGADPMPDSLSDALGGEPLAGLGADPLSGLSSMLPGALSGLGAASPLDALSGLAGEGAPLAGLASQLGDRPADHDGDTDSDKPDHDSEGRKSERAGADGKGPEPAQDQHPGDPQPGPQTDGTAGAGAPPAGPAPATAPTTVVALPDGSTATARTPALAQAVKANLAGTPIDAAYRQAGMELPPPGTPVTNPVDPSRLSCGTIGMFKDHYVLALSAVKAYQDGQVVPLASVASGPDFLGWVDPTAVGAATTAAAAPPAPVAEPAPAGAG